MPDEPFTALWKEISGKEKKCISLLTELWTSLRTKLLPFAKRKHHIIHCWHTLGETALQN